jgi:acylphosphatase
MTGETEEHAVAVRIQGQVQGVGFRAWTVRAAERRGLRGWVCNRFDGSVEALFIGAEASVSDMVAACRRGPAGARVTDVAVSAAADDGSSGFRQRASV